MHQISMNIFEDFVLVDVVISYISRHPDTNILHNHLKKANKNANIKDVF